MADMATGRVEAVDGLEGAMPQQRDSRQLDAATAMCVLPTSMLAASTSGFGKDSDKVFGGSDPACEKSDSETADTVSGPATPSGAASPCHHAEGEPLPEADDAHNETETAGVLGKSMVARREAAMKLLGDLEPRKYLGMSALAAAAGVGSRVVSPNTKRHRPCTGCRAIKLKCDRGVPCGRCKRLGLVCTVPPTVSLGRPRTHVRMPTATHLRLPDAATLLEGAAINATALLSQTASTGDALKPHKAAPAAAAAPLPLRPGSAETVSETTSSLQSPLDAPPVGSTADAEVRRASAESRLASVEARLVEARLLEARWLEARLLEARFEASQGRFAQRRRLDEESKLAQSGHAHGQSWLPTGPLLSQMFKPSALLAPAMPVMGVPIPPMMQNQIVAPRTLGWAWAGMGNAPH